MHARSPHAVIGVIAGEGRPIISPVGLLVLHNGLFRISDRGGPDKFSFREKGEKRGHGGRRRSKSVPPIFFQSEGGRRAKSGGMGWRRDNEFFLIS